MHVSRGLVWLKHRKIWKCTTILHGYGTVAASTDLMGHAETFFDVAGSQFAEVYIVLHPAAAVYAQGFVHHVPGIDPAIEVPDGCLNVPERGDENGKQHWEATRSGQTRALAVNATSIVLSIPLESVHTLRGENMTTRVL